MIASYINLVCMIRILTMYYSSKFQLYDTLLATTTVLKTYSYLYSFASINQHLFISLIP